MSRFKDKHSNFDSCTRDRRISFREKGKEYKADNVDLKKTARYRIDDKSDIKNDNKRCDYALYIFDPEKPNLDDDRLILIELKGSDIARAIKQIKQSIKDLVESYKLNPKRVDARIVVSKNRNPKYYATNEVRLKSRLKSFGEKKGDFKVQAKVMNERI